MFVCTAQCAVAAASAELRTLRRLPRTWLFGAAAAGAGLAAFTVQSMHHLAYSAYSAMLGGIDPRFLVAGYGGLALWTALAGLVLLAFDARARDERDGIAETLDARPAANIGLLTGRLAALVVVGWLPLAALAVAVALLGVVAKPLGWPVGSLPEPFSLAAFLLIDAPTALIAWGAALALLSAALRSRLAVAAIALAILGCLFWAVFHTPLYLLPALFGPVAFGAIASDMLPHFADAADAAQRAGLVVAAAGWVLASAALYPRRETSPGPLLACGIALMVLGACAIGVLAAQARAAVDERAQWAAVHAASRDRPRADIQRIVGTVRVDPGAVLELQLEVSLRVPAEAPSADLLLSFNPGMRIEELRIGSRRADYRHENGLLAVALPEQLAPRAATALSLRATGVPDARFAYLDEAVDPMALTLADSLLHILGTEASLFGDVETLCGAGEENCVDD